jgi:hypothetical protein
VLAGHGHTVYAGDTATGAIFKGDIRTGQGSVLVLGVAGGSAFGVFVDRWNRIWAAGDRTGHAFVHDADTGSPIADITLVPADATDADSGHAKEIVLDHPVPRGGGLILKGHTLYVVENPPTATLPGLGGEIAVVEREHHPSEGKVVDRLNADPPLPNPATADRTGPALTLPRSVRGHTEH